jgi:sialate O-acetylesterase
MASTTRLFLCLLFVAQSIAAIAQVRLPQLISDGIVLQRDTKVKVWGWAKAGEKVSVKFAAKRYKTTTDVHGKWSITLNPIKAGGPYSMNIDASNHIAINNILIGDVWFCSGQSNMVLPMERVKEKYPDEIKNANYPQIRNFFVPTLADVSNIHDDLPKGKWMEATPQNVLGFGAASYFFAKKIYERYHVPIGLINSSVGGTPIQAWISSEGLKDIATYANRVDRLRDTVYLNKLRHPEKKPADEPAFSKPDPSANPQIWQDTTSKLAGWHSFWLPGYWADQGVRNLNGILWFRKVIDVPASMAGQPAKLFMGRIVDADYVFVNGVFCGNTTYQYPPRRYKVPQGVLKEGKNVIVVAVANFSGKGGFVPDKPYFLSAGDQRIDLRGDWQYKVIRAFTPEQLAGGYRFSAQNEPTGLYNTMVAPAIDYGIKGFLWYQGEANTGKPAEYGELMKALINDWRDKWHEGELPFLYVQLPGFMEVQYLPSESQWAQLRETQLETLSIPKTGMAVAIDAGEWNDIHPLDKKDVGDRLALLAEKIAYGDQNLIASGPIYKSAEVKGDEIIISFDSTGSGPIAKGGGTLTQFAIAGADKKYIWADAIIEGDKVIVSSKEVSKPMYVRYAWADNPEGANLYNKEGLPASPFTTDTGANK